MLRQVLADREEERARLEQERATAAAKPSVEDIMSSVEQFRTDIMNAIRDNVDAVRAENVRQQEETLNAIRATAQEQVPFNIRAYLDEFSRSLAAEVRMLLSEVGALREEKRALQYRIGCMMQDLAKYEPGGEYNPDYRPVGCKPAGEAAAPEPEPPAPEVPQTAPGAWRPVRVRRSRKSRDPAGPPPGAGPPPMSAAPPMPIPITMPVPPMPSMARHTGASWPAPWHPDPTYAPSSPSVEIQPELLQPPRSSPGLFGPRSPPGSVHRQ